MNFSRFAIFAKRHVESFGTFSLNGLQKCRNGFFASSPDLTEFLSVAWPKWYTPLLIEFWFKLELSLIAVVDWFFLDFVRQSFKITRLRDRPVFLPEAHTCFNQLVLPDYPDRDTLQQKLVIALSNAEGFGLEWKLCFRQAFNVSYHIISMCPLEHGSSIVRVDLVVLVV